MDKSKENMEAKLLAKDYASLVLNRDVTVYALLEANPAEYVAYFKGYTKAQEKYKYTEEDMEKYKKCLAEIEKLVVDGEDSEGERALKLDKILHLIQTLNYEKNS